MHLSLVIKMLRKNKNAVTRKTFTPVAAYFYASISHRRILSHRKIIIKNRAIAESEGGRNIPHCKEQIRQSAKDNKYVTTGGANETVSNE